MSNIIVSSGIWPAIRFLERAIRSLAAKVATIPTTASGLLSIVKVGSTMPPTTLAAGSTTMPTLTIPLAWPPGSSYCKVTVVYSLQVNYTRTANTGAIDIRVAPGFNLNSLPDSASVFRGGLVLPSNNDTNRILRIGGSISSVFITDKATTSIDWVCVVTMSGTTADVSAVKATSETGGLSYRVEYYSGPIPTIS